MKKRRGCLGTLFLWAFILVGVVPVAIVALYRFVPPPVTYLMLQRRAEGEGLDYRWRPLSRISPELRLAAIASEDARFCSHDGFDTEAIAKALARNAENPERIRGGSTISQQTAKNAFLWPQRSWLRKGVEAWFTFLIELIWPKQRVLEVYLNVAEWGPGVYGAEAASQHWFGKSADKLSRLEAARLASILPSPRRYKAASPGPLVRKRTRATLANMSVIRRDGLGGCLS